MKIIFLIVVFMFSVLNFFTSYSVVFGDTSITFPVDEAGIAAYVKLDSVDQAKIIQAANVFSSFESGGDDYVIGDVELVEMHPHIYLGLDGWIVAYFLKGEESSRIVNWDQGELSETILKNAIDKVATAIGTGYSVSDLKYYDFSHPQANKLSIIKKHTGGSGSFSVLVPGTIYEAAYTTDPGTRASIPQELDLDNGTIFYDIVGDRKYGIFGLAGFQSYIGHSISYVCNWDGTVYAVIIYQT